MKKLSVFLCAMFLVFGMVGIVGTGAVYASVISITELTGSQALDYIIGTPAPLPFTLKANFSDDQKLYVWDEVQNFTLPGNLYVDRVADPTADFIGGSSGSYYIKTGTIVSSHYVQWDPAAVKTVKARLEFDSDIFAFITADQKLFDSDAWLGLTGITYGDFGARGLETGDGTVFNSGMVDIDWAASNPGDWTRLITAYSPGVEPVPVPATMLLLGSGLVGLAGFRNKLRKR